MTDNGYKKVLTSLAESMGMSSDTQPTAVIPEREKKIRLIRVRQSSCRRHGARHSAACSLEAKVVSLCTKVEALLERIAHALSPEGIVNSWERLALQVKEVIARLDANHGLEETIADQAETLKGLSTRVRELEDDVVSEHVLKPMLLDTALLYDQTVRLRKAVQDDTALNRERLVEHINGLEQEIVGVLRRRGATLMTDTTAKLNPRKQKVVGVRRVSLPEDKTVAEVVRTGVYLKESVLRPEEVIVNDTSKEGPR